MSGNYHRYYGDDPYWACHANETLHPLYHQCFSCKHANYCDLFAVEKLKASVDEPQSYEMPRRNFKLNKTAVEDKIWEFGLKHGLIYKPEDVVYYDKFAGHYARREITFSWWIRRIWEQIKRAF